MLFFEPYLFAHSVDDVPILTVHQISRAIDVVDTSIIEGVQLEMRMSSVSLDLSKGGFFFTVNSSRYSSMIDGRVDLMALLLAPWAE
jgi:hypothetical protein